MMMGASFMLAGGLLAVGIMWAARALSKFLCLFDWGIK